MFLLVYSFLRLSCSPLGTCISGTRLCHHSSRVLDEKDILVDQYLAINRRIIMFGKPEADRIAQFRKRDEYIANAKPYADKAVGWAKENPSEVMLR